MASPIDRSIPPDLQLHLANRPDADIGNLDFNLDLLCAFAGGECPDAAAETLPLGNYLPVLLTHAGWWMTAVDLAVSERIHDAQVGALRAQLGATRGALAEVLALVPEAWSETYVHAGSSSQTHAGRLLLSRYAEFRKGACELLAAALPGADLEPIRGLP